VSFCAAVRCVVFPSPGAGSLGCRGSVHEGFTTGLPGPRIDPVIETQGANMTARKHFTSDEAKRIGEALGIDWSEFDVEQYRMGLDVELEHGLIDPHTNVTNDDPMMTGKIALAHLNEFPDYYTRLEKMEREAEGK
jgi:hypothetical protein